MNYGEALSSDSKPARSGFFLSAHTLRAHGELMNHLKVNQAAGVEIVRAAPIANILNPRGRFVVSHYRNGKRINEYVFENAIVNEGKNKLLNVMFSEGTQIATWYIGLIDNANFSALAADDIYDDIDQAGNGWDEFQNYTDANNADSAVTRPAWPEDAASGQAMTNSTTAIFDITGTATVKGVFVVGGTNAQTKGDHTAGTANVLWATALFNSGDTPVLSGDQLKVTYSITT